MTSRARPGISKGLLAQLIALVRADEAGSLGDETEMVDLGGIAAAAVAERVPAALAAGNRETFAASGGGGHAKGAGSRRAICWRRSMAASPIDSGRPIYKWRKRFWTRWLVRGSANCM